MTDLGFLRGNHGGHCLTPIADFSGSATGEVQ